MKKRILFYIYGLNIGGAESFVYNLLDSLGNEYHIDFCLQSRLNTNTKLISLIEESGGNIYYIPEFNKHLILSGKRLKKLLKANEYDHIHIHLNSLINFSPIVVGCKCGINTIVHSHNTENASGGAFGKIIHKFNRRRLKNKNVVCLACGEEAGEWMFADKKFFIIPNGINSEAFAYSEEARGRIRKLYSFNNNDIVLGHVGRFSLQKNHKFLIDQFEKAMTLNPNLKLLLVGDGETKKSLESLVLQKQLTNSIYFAGSQTNIADYYSAFDALVFPSLYEGLPFALIEAQASGLPIVASDTITKDVSVTDLIKFIPLEANEWVAAISEIKSDKIMRKKYYSIVSESHFDINNTVKSMRKIYEEQK